MVTELKRVPEVYDFYITEDITETTYATLKKDVMTKVREINDLYENNRDFYRNNGMNPKDYSPEKPTFVFYLSTFGGDCYTGLGICDMLANLDRNENLDVEMYAEGKVMSMGIPILLSVENRFCSPNTTFMIHELSAFSFGKLDYIKERVEELDRLQGMVNNIITNNTKITMEELKRFYDRKSDYFFGAEKAVDLGLVKNIM